MHHRRMRTTLTIDNDVLAAAKHLAEREHRSLGEVISSLARRGLRHDETAVPAMRNGLPLLATKPSALPVTLDLVNGLRDEIV